MNLSFKQSHKYLWKTSVFITSIVLSLSLLFSTDLSSVDALSKVGSRGEEVVKIQTKLKELGLYTGNIDGTFGSQTETAVKNFQYNLFSYKLRKIVLLIVPYYIS